MGKFWNKMLILEKDDKEPISGNALFISQERPLFFVDKVYKHKSSFKDTFSDKDILILEKL